jgi:hypothetical protein
MGLVFAILVSFHPPETSFGPWSFCSTIVTPKGRDGAGHWILLQYPALPCRPGSVFVLVCRRVNVVTASLFTASSSSSVPKIRVHKVSVRSDHSITSQYPFSYWVSSWTGRSNILLGPGICLTRLVHRVQMVISDLYIRVVPHQVWERLPLTHPDEATETSLRLAPVSRGHEAVPP